MKKTLLTSAILAAFASGSVSAAEVYKDDTQSVDIYGKVQGMYYDTKTKKYDGDQSYFRLGVKAKSAITESAYALARLEMEYAATRRSENDIRLGYAGLGDKQLGELTYGRQYGAYTLIADYTDVLFEFGADASGTGTDTFGTGKSDALLKYAVNLGGATIETNYQTDNNLQEVNGDTAQSYGIAASYGFDFGVNFGAAYNNGERLTAGAGNAEMTAVAVNYDANNIYAALLYSFGENWDKKDLTENNVDYNATEVALGYSFDNGLGLLVGYNWQEAEAGNVKEDTVDYYTVGAIYQYNKQFEVGFEYLINEVKDEDDILALGAVYKF